MIAALEELGAYVESKRRDCVLTWDVTNGELNIDVAPSSIVDFVDFLKVDSTCRFSSLVDITAVDYTGRVKRFDVVYHFLSMYQNHRIRLRISIREEEMVPSITEVHPSANWFEREVFDMYGVLFSGHPDLRRILTDYGFRGYPLRKDFPTTGYTEVRYDEMEKEWFMNRSVWFKSIASLILCHLGRERSIYYRVTKKKRSRVRWIF